MKKQRTINHNVTDEQRANVLKMLTVDPALYEKATADHLHDLRVKLLERGYIKTISQKYVYTDEAKEFCLEWYSEDLARQDEKGSTGSWGKYFEVYCRVNYSICRGVPFAINDCKCRKAGLRDMYVKVNGGVYGVEAKVGGGSIAYGCDEISALEAREKFFRHNPILVWDFDCNGEPLCMRADDLLVLLAQYNPTKGIETWFAYCKNYDSDGNKRNRAFQIQFSIASNNADSKKAYLRELKKSPLALDWKRLVEHAEFRSAAEGE